jgi:hypothetical protein
MMYKLSTSLLMDSTMGMHHMHFMLILCLLFFHSFFLFLDFYLIVLAFIEWSRKKFVLCPSDYLVWK